MIDRLNDEEYLLSSRITVNTFKHFIYINKTNCMPEAKYKDNENSSSENETARFFNEFFHLVVPGEKYTH